MMEYLTIDGLSKMTGVPINQFDVYVLKELIDNALDACELEKIPPTLEVIIQPSSQNLTIQVADKGKGISEEMIKEITNFERFGGTKYFVKKPTRGAQGNALMTILGIAPVLAIECEIDYIPTEFLTKNQKYTISLTVDNVLEKVNIDTEKSEISEHMAGTTVKVTLPRAEKTWGEDKSRYDKALEEFALWNPHVEIHYTYGSNKKTLLKGSSRKINKYGHDGFGSIHWYTLDNFESLLYANIRFLEEQKEKESIINFAKNFKGCSSNREEFTRQLTEGLPKYINEIRDEETSERLFNNIKSLVKPPAPSVLGEIGKEHFYNVMNRYKVIDKLFKYKKIKGELDNTNIPFVLETAIGPTEELESRKVAFGINNTITYRSPFEEDLFQPSNVNERDCPWKRVKGIRELLYAYEIEPDDPVMVVIHLISPNIMYGDYGKSSFDTGGRKY